MTAGFSQNSFCLPRACVLDKKIASGTPPDRPCMLFRLSCLSVHPAMVRRMYRTLSRITRLPQQYPRIDTVSPAPVSRETCSVRSLARVLRDAGAPCPENALPGLVTYITTLMRWNRVMNLVGASDWQEAARDLVSDCLRLADFLRELPLPQAPLCTDLGAGAGLPGIPLRLVWTDGAYHMVEIRQKRALFLAQMLGTLSLTRTFAHNMDARRFLAGNAPDLVLSRAFLPWEQVLGLVADNLAGSGWVVFMASAAPAPEEVTAKARGFAFRRTLAYRSAGRERCFWACQRGDMA